MSFFAENTEILYSLAVALGIGLLVGAERERRKSKVDKATAAGLRTFAIVSLLGAVGFWLGGAIVLGVCVVVVTAMVSLAYLQSAKESLGLTTEIAVVLTVLLGAASVKSPGIAAGLGVLLTVLLAARDPMHRFVKTLLTEHEANDALILAAATLIVLPLMPDQYMGPYEAINPAKIWLVVILVLSISAMGHIASRMMGSHRGLPIAGFFSGFISGTLTIAAMGARVKAHPALAGPAAAGAIWATVASLVQLSVIMGTFSQPLLMAMALPITCAMAVAGVYGLIFMAFTRHQDAGGDYKNTGHAFSLKTALYFAAVIAVVFLVSAVLHKWFGDTGVLVATGVAGLVDTHAAAASVSSLVSADKLDVQVGLLAILIAMTVNTGSRMVLAVLSHSRKFALYVVPGLLLMTLAAWGGTFLQLPVLR